MFNVGDKVFSRKTGLPASGEIQGIFCAKYYWAMNFQNFSPIRWAELYPDWADKKVMVVRYSSPQRHCSLEEWCNSGGVPLDHPMAKTVYEAQVPLRAYSYYPEDDLELVEAAVANQ